jgi:MerR family transcriptional regulator, copper efflux regulator
MASQSEQLKIGDFASLAGTNLRTLRYYEELGLIVPASRSTGGFRYYRPTDVNRVRMIRDLQDLGLHLDRIRELLGDQHEIVDRQGFICRVRRALQEHDHLLQDRLELLRLQRAKVSQALAQVAVCEACPYTPAIENNRCEPCTRTGDQLPEHLSALF